MENYFWKQRNFINEENRQNLAKYITLITEDSHIFQTSIYEISSL